MEITDLYNDTEVLDDMTKPYTENKAFLELFGIFHFVVSSASGKLNVVFVHPIKLLFDEEKNVSV